MVIDLKYRLTEIFSQRVYNGEAFGLEMRIKLINNLYLLLSVLLRVQTRNGILSNLKSLPAGRYSLRVSFLAMLYGHALCGFLLGVSQLVYG